MWTLAEATVPTSAGGGGDNIYTLLIALAVILLGSGGVLRVRSRRRHPEEIEPEPVARQVISGTEPFLKRRISQLEKEVVEADRKAHDQQVRIEQFIRDLASCEAERNALQRQLSEVEPRD